MPKFFAKLLAALNKLRETIFKGLFRARFRYDIFISYAHGDAKKYASSLKKQLSSLDFSCFIDEEEAPAGVSLNPTVNKALTKSAVLVLLGTSHALTRPYIALEVEKFALTERAIIPVNIADALVKDEAQVLSTSPWKVIKDRDLIWLDETQEAFEKNAPSPHIADGIDKLFKYTRRNTRVRTEIILTAAIVLIAALGAGYIIKGKTDELAQQSKRNDELRTETVRLEGDANDARKRAEAQQQIAEQATTEAEKQLEAARVATEEAKRQEEIASQAKQEAMRQQEIATKAAGEARRQQQLAHEAGLEARRQQNIAEARELANEAERTRGNSSGLSLGVSAAAAIKSLELHPTLEGDSALRNALNLLPPLTSETPFFGDYMSAALSPNATAVAFLTPDNQLEIKRADKKIVQRSRPAMHQYIALSNDGRYVATAGGNTALLQNTETSESRSITIFESSTIKALALSPGAKYLAVIASEDEGLWVEVWETESGKLIGKPVHGDIESSLLRDVAFSSDKDELLAVGGQEKRGGSINGFLRTWLIKRESNDAGSERSGKQANQTPTYRFEPQAVLRQPGELETVAVYGDDYLLTADRETALVWKRTRLGDYRQVARMQLEFPLALAFDPNGSHVHAVSESAEGSGLFPINPKDKSVRIRGNKTVKIWESSGRQEQAQAILSDEILAISFRPDRDLVTTLSRTNGATENRVQVWNAKDAKQVKQEEIEFKPQGEYDLSGDGRYLAGVDEQGLVQIWDLIDKKKLEGRLSAQGLDSIKGIKLSYDGKFLALAGAGQGSDAALIVYQRFDGEYKAVAPTLILPLRTELETFALSPDGNLVATTNRDYEVQIWSVKTGRAAIPKPFLEVDTVRALLFSPTGRFVVALSAIGITIWELSTGKTVAFIVGRYTWKTKVANYAIAFSRNERYIAIGNYVGDASVWEVKTGQELMRLQHDDPVVSVAFDRDGKYLATATAVIDTETARRKPSVLRTWLVQPLDLIAETCRRSPGSCAEQTRLKLNPNR